MMSLKRLSICLVLLASWGGELRAAANCTVAATGPAFGIYDTLNASPTLANGTVSATCTWTGGSSTTVSMVSSYSTGSSGNYTNRTMLFGSFSLFYNLYYNAAFTSIRGDGTGGSATGSATLFVSAAQPTATTSAVVYGRIPASQNSPPGNYSDTITFTITY
jgi:spore coat protein U-like protein